MTNSTLHLPARDIPVPASVSPEAQAILAMGPLGPPQAWPALDDVEGWRALVSTGNRNTLAMGAEGGPMAALWGNAGTADIRDHEVDDVTVYDIRPEGVAAHDRRVYLEVHGGAWVFGGGAVLRMTAPVTARDVGARVWAVDYRMPPEHPFPTPVDDCLAAYRHLLEQRRPEEIIVGGGSAGGNLVAGMLVRARDEGLPMPAALVIQTGAFDLTASGDSLSANQGLDIVLTGDFAATMKLYAGGEDLRHPHISPLFADLSGFPPTILATGTRDLLLSDNVRMHRALLVAGVEAELHVWEAAGHGGFLGAAPEDKERTAQIRRFVDRHWGRT